MEGEFGPAAAAEEPLRESLLRRAGKGLCSLVAEFPILTATLSGVGISLTWLWGNHSCIVLYWYMLGNLANRIRVSTTGNKLGSGLAMSGCLALLLFSYEVQVLIVTV